MASMKETARKNLEKMVKGAAREVVTSRPTPSETTAPTNPRVGATAGPSVAAPSTLSSASASASPSTLSSPAITDADEREKSGGISKAALQQLTALIAKNGRTIQKVPLESIHLDENIRESYDEVALKHLADSLEKDGLIQFPTLALKEHKATGAPAFVCKNGHRRILAAKSLGWKVMECIILPFASARDELYHTIAANLREDVFYLDMAAVYQQAAHLGESDQAIAERSGVNPRTVGWYRRLTRMSAECQALCRQHSELFNATWAIKLARLGELPVHAILLKQMQAMIARQKAFSQEPQGDKAEKAVDKVAVKASREQLRGILSSTTDESKFAWNLVDQLCTAGYLTPRVVDRLRRSFDQKAQKPGPL